MDVFISPQGRRASFHVYVHVIVVVVNKQIVKTIFLKHMASYGQMLPFIQVGCPRWPPTEKLI